MLISPVRRPLSDSFVPLQRCWSLTTNRGSVVSLPATCCLYPLPGSLATSVRTGGSSEDTHESRLLDSLLSHLPLPTLSPLPPDLSQRSLFIALAIAVVLSRSLLWSLSLSRLLGLLLYSRLPPETLSLMHHNRLLSRPRPHHPSPPPPLQAHPAAAAD